VARRALARRSAAAVAAQAAKPASDVAGGAKRPSGVAAGATPAPNSVALQYLRAHDAAAPAPRAPAGSAPAPASVVPAPASGAPPAGIKQRLAAAGHSLRDAWDDLLDQRPDEARLDAAEELARFRRKRFDDEIDFKPRTQHGRFDAALDPRTGTLRITLRVAFEFVAGDPRAVEEGFRPEEFRWTPAQIAEWKARALHDVNAQWRASPFEIRSRRPYWESMRIRPEVRVVEDPSHVHFRMVVKKYPSDAKSVTSSVFAPGTHPDAQGREEPNRSGDTTGTAALDSNDLRHEQKLDSDNPVKNIPFERGSPELDDAGRAALAPIAAQLAGVAGAHVQLTGRACVDDVAGATPAEDAVANMDLARGRTAAVHEALVALHVDPKQILVRNAGQAGAGRDEQWCRVDAQVGTHELQLPLLHEGGHMLASGDEYVAEIGGVAGRPLPDERYRLSARHYTAATLTQGYTASLMSAGSTLERQHLSGFVDAVRAITGVDEWCV
jgi:outer membrane protein OmpA-like peptidoglycan-associated protein